ncbi:hypothetical protein FHR61_003685, partial [Xanthomonas arboricola]|nr:hypothetical protein [Xanthomonas cannabis]MBB5523805.1 hypothetical protein [Xanthomonas cannabis]
MVCAFAAGPLPAHHRRTRRKYIPVATVLLEWLWLVHKPGTVVPAAGR